MPAHARSSLRSRGSSNGTSATAANTSLQADSLALAAELMFAEYVTTLPSESSRWWESRRLGYNAGLVIACILAFAAYTFVLIHFHDVIRAPSPSEEDAFSGLTLLLQGFGWLIMMFVANVCFFLGPLSEQWLRPRNVDAYRKIAFRLGFWCSVALPFSIPVLLTLLAVFYPAYWQTTAR